MIMQTLDERQATERVERHIALAVDALADAGLPVERELVSELRTECTDPTDFGPAGRIQVARRYWLRGTPFEAFEAALAHWTSNGYRVLEDARDRAVEDMKTGERHAAPLLWVEHDGDGFRMTLVSSASGDLSLVATSPCIWPDGKP